MNRTDRLVKMLPSWIKLDSISEIIITDWNSKFKIIEDQNICNILKASNKIKIIRLNGEEYFNQGKSYNLAYQFTDLKYKFLLKLDVDYINLKFNDWLVNLLKENLFMTGFIEKNKPYFNGFLFLNKKFFEQGYNENMPSLWGGDDTDLYNRIENTFHIKREIFFDIENYIYHIPHNDHLRTENLKIKNRKPIYKIISRIYPEWEPQTYRVLKDNSYYKELEIDSPSRPKN
ncbi:MAG: hypothetical protein EBV19_10785, partial [Flavobacteriia bacterium]|nr:hypothetical protein [Flavobacteriia bacterium]